MANAMALGVAGPMLVSGGRVGRGCGCLVSAMLGMRTMRTMRRRRAGHGAGFVGGDSAVSVGAGVEQPGVALYERQPDTHDERQQPGYSGLPHREMLMLPASGGHGRHLAGAGITPRPTNS